MKLSSRTPWLALLAGALLAFSVHAQIAPKPEPGPGQEPDPKILNDIADCLAQGLPQEWQRAWFVINEIDRDERSATRSFEANFFYATEANSPVGRRLQTCGPEKIIENVKALNAYLADSQQRWTSATFTFTRDGKFDAKYDFEPPKPRAEPAPAAAKPPAKARSSSKKKPEASK